VHARACVRQSYPAPDSTDVLCESAGAAALRLRLREWSATVAFTGTTPVEYKYVVCKADSVRWEVASCPFDLNGVALISLFLHAVRGPCGHGCVAPSVAEAVALLRTP
jgi:hypothetical protein